VQHWILASLCGLPFFPAKVGVTKKNWRSTYDTTGSAFQWSEQQVGYDHGKKTLLCPKKSPISKNYGEVEIGLKVQ